MTDGSRMYDGYRVLVLREAAVRPDFSSKSQSREHSRAFPQPMVSRVLLQALSLKHSSSIQSQRTGVDL